MDIQKKEKLAALQIIRDKMKTHKISTIELAKFLNIDSVSLSDFLFYRKVPNDKLINKISTNLEKLEMSKFKSLNEEPTFIDLSFSDFEASKIPPKLGEKICRIREKIQLNREELASCLKPPVSSQIVAYWEDNIIIPKLEYCVQLSDLGVVTLDWLLRD
ncbi:hypothetical protein ACFO26_06790 [Lactococcus nasutitermitis]|uniref:HTH cro/C1-type domain-containing protein n=1 Tax=Lactococcus nasutitermitis TaxID=1652957 RepID=A0ABV9JF91_9LACT|nr:hypothetical protein [Lactococcus nasutitermitis]